MTAVLDVQDIARSFGGIKAIDGVSFSVSQGEVFGIIGPNGAGKTVLLNLINGIYGIERGSIHLGGVRIDGARAHKIAQLGIARTFQSTEQFKECRVIDYVMLGRFRHQWSSQWACALSWPGVARSEREEHRMARETLDRVGLGDAANERMSDLAYGVQKQIDVARVMAAEPKLMLLDEPTSGTNSEERFAIADLLAEASRGDTTMIIVDHDVRFLGGQCQRLMAMNYGQKLGEGTPKEVLARKDVLEAYLGAQMADVEVDVEVEGAGPVDSVDE
jgi:branched-chain amino acid transport system ATP-binding protein